MKVVLICSLLLCCSGVTFAKAKDTCGGSHEGKRVLWGDLHVHTGFSLDATAFGTIKTPADAYRFAKGRPIQLPDGTTVQLQRPLDFMAVTDHAEWFDLVNICTSPSGRNKLYCSIMAERSGLATGMDVFVEYVQPTISGAQPKPAEICQRDPQACAEAQLSQWEKSQAHTEAANEPCVFTALQGYEWSATPENSHNHRNIIFRNQHVTDSPIDYLRFPSVEALWRELDRQCRAEDGCEAIAIPHNTNMGDGKSFDVESEPMDVGMLRARYERLVEVHQEKGASECLYAFGQPDEDCNFELSLSLNTRPMSADEFTEEQWKKMRSTYVRSLLGRGIQRHAQAGFNPLKIGVIGSTDNHAATGGFVEEDQWRGSVVGMGTIERTMARLSWNPGGLVAVWSEANTRDHVFEALQRREVYATSGPRIRLRVDAAMEELSCTSSEKVNTKTVPMGGDLSSGESSPAFRIEVLYDRTPIQSIEVIKGEYVDGTFEESVTEAWQSTSGQLSVCTVWQDPNFSADSYAYWYVRVKEAPTLRWSAHICRREGRCDDFPGAETAIQERAWSSPIWYTP